MSEEALESQLLSILLLLALMGLGGFQTFLAYRALVTGKIRVRKPFGWAWEMTWVGRDENPLGFYFNVISLFFAGLAIATIGFLALIGVIEWP